ncbi:MAG: 16S rRNA (cytidine(1402)-2'-O)-methyltransferase [Gammaproteobacteria bacterium]|nr:16S rRNA (cytidine(1402)-2'-O)-methyltransferase [Gammaproteobacteria bacterium]
MSNNTNGVLYVVATPIGNLEDMTARAARVLSEVALIAAEDTRHSARLLDHFGIDTKMLPLHEHNEAEQTAALLQLLRQGKSVALISDAGTPLVSDPGFRLVQAAQAAGVRVAPVPGACAAIAALSVAGLPTDRFVFEGFPPPKPAARRAAFAALRAETRTVIFYETPHRLAECLQDLRDVFGAERPAVLARELTKQYETVRAAPLAELAAWVAGDANQQRGESVLLVRGAPPAEERGLDAEAERILRVLLQELPVKQAAALAAAITGLKKNRLYQYALDSKSAERD